MTFLEWNVRTVPLFAEEMPEAANADHRYPSIKSFQQPGIYSSSLRNRLAAYIHGCPGIIATSLKRFHPYLGAYRMELAYYTDGEVIFNNFLHDYIRCCDFAIPALWLKLIEAKGFTTGGLKIDADICISGEVDVFQTISQTFQEMPAVRKAVVAGAGPTNIL